MGAPHREARSYLIAFGDQFLQRPLNVRKAPRIMPIIARCPAGPRIGSERPGTWNTAFEEISSAASFSLAVLMNSVKRCIVTLMFSVVILIPFAILRPRIG